MSASSPLPPLLDGERLDDLQFRSLRLIQKKGGYTFTSDAVLLANLIRPLSGGRACELGAGSGVISILVAAKKRPSHVVGVELQPRLADMARRSVALNGLQDVVSIWQGDMRACPDALGKGSFDAVFSNPPYRRVSADYAPTQQPNERQICCLEYKITLEEVIATAASLLKFGGDFYLITKHDRLTDALVGMRAADIEPKCLTLVQPTPAKRVDTVVVRGKKGGKPGLLVEKPLVLMDASGAYTPEAKRLYCL